MIQITKYFVEFFLDGMQGCTLIYFACDTVSAMDICGSQQSTWHPGKRKGPSVHPLYVHLPRPSFNIYFMKQWCLTKVQNDDCVFLCSLLGASFPTSFTKPMSAGTPEIVLHFFLDSQGINTIVINTTIGIILKNAMAYIRCHFLSIAHTIHAYTCIPLFPVSGSDQNFTWWDVFL